MVRAGVIAAWLLLVPAFASAQDYIDRTRVVVGGRVIMDSDIPAARKLKLVPRTLVEDDATTQTALENRLLILAEIRSPGFSAPTDQEVADRRRQWEQSLDAGVTAAAALAEARMTDEDLLAWLREDVRIEKYERERFGRETNPEAAIQAWVLGLRKRAGLK